MHLPDKTVRDDVEVNDSLKRAPDTFLRCGEVHLLSFEGVVTHLADRIARTGASGGGEGLVGGIRAHAQKVIYGHCMLVEKDSRIQEPARARDLRS